ncbi:MAG: single-stranded DNA-binding protein [Ruminococcaceae bacterium]|nr:single-stranded DNA-binding protein [Oscillospiraceae bacterium]
MLNCAIIMGRLTADPELRTTSNGINVTSFSVAVDRSYQKPGEERQTDFINVVAWRGTAEFITRYFRKGSMIAIQGSIQTRNYEDKTGARRTAVEIVADNVSFCGSKAETGTGTFQKPETSVAEEPAEVSEAPSFSTANADDFNSVASMEDELPF